MAVDTLYPVSFFISENALLSDRESLHNEIEVMSRVTPHPNIVNMLGYCKIGKCGSNSVAVDPVMTN